MSWKCPYFEVQLTNAKWPLELHPTPCGPARTLHVGTTRLPFTLRASHTAGDGSWKPLPPGTYLTQLFPAPKAAHPLPITVHVVAKGNHAK